jgi:hypothetical protein
MEELGCDYDMVAKALLPAAGPNRSAIPKLGVMRSATETKAAETNQK